MKANVFTSIFIALFFFAINSSTVKADSNATLYHNVEKHENVISTTYFKGDGNSENLAPFKKKVDTLNEQDLCISKLTYIWSSNENKWVPSDKLEYTYDGQNVIAINRSVWNNKKQIWNEPKTINYNQTENNN